MTARWIVLVLYLALMIGIGVYYRRKSASVNDFVLGGRGLGAWFTAFAYGTSYFSAVIFVGYAGKFGWNYGVASTWVGIGNAVIGSWLAWKVLGRRTRIMSKHLEAKTMPEYLKEIQQQAFEDSFGTYRVRIPYPLYGFGLQRLVKTF